MSTGVRRWASVKFLTDSRVKLLFNENNLFYIRPVRHYAMAGPVIDVKQGKLRGVLRDSVEGGKYFLFRGVPYAEPPVGQLRFKEPQPLKSWSGIKDALEDCKVSAQFDLITRAPKGGDDCLYLNVATNSLTKKRPVMVWIHGGAFKQSSNAYKTYGPDYLLQKDIVFVSLNYRLGLLGFLNMEHEECAGNQGLHDQIAALKWIKENIEVFGGDAENITIFGESAGAASVHGLCLSPQTKGLFHKAIMQSGVLSSPWALSTSNKDLGYSTAKALGKECTSPLQVVEFLRTLPALKIIEMSEDIYRRELQPFLMSLVLAPTADVKSSNPILPQPVKVMEKNGIDIPVLMGYNSHEGIIRFFRDTSNLIKGFNEDFEGLLGQYLDVNNIPKLSSRVQALREFYLGNKKVDGTEINELVQLVGDMLFVSNILNAADIQMHKESPTYLYKFSYRPDYLSMAEIMKVHIEGTCHGDELGCLFYSKIRGEKLCQGTRDHNTMERMTTMWTNFAKTGNPTPVTDEIITTKWRPLENNKKYYLDITDNLTCSENPDNEKWNLWKPLLQST